ncbi:acyltransferase family protein [Methyloligella solikamskensis]|uniref:Acyltransferase family protein n=1 Tax=Methyloligella solikamskensis TaxID=1177756 RepID=A0ABW3J5W0_9HYPH
MDVKSGFCTPMKNFQSIHYLRGIAAFGVLLYHAVVYVSGYGSHQLPANLAAIGMAGVDIFFVISGFILVVTMNPTRSAGEFMAGRVARVGLPYWSVLLALACASLVIPSAFRNIDWNGLDLMASFLFLPTVMSHGGLFPILEPGWTLCLEMLFYILLAASLSLAPAFRSVAICAALGALVGAGLILDLPPGEGLGWFFTQSVLLEFCFGIAIAQIYMRGIEIGRGAAMMLLALSCIGFAIAAFHPPEAFAPIRVLTFGIPATLLVAGAVFLERAGGWFGSRTLMFLGTVSYSLYLTHALVLGVTVRLMAGRLPGLGGDIVMLTVAIAVSLVGAFVFYRIVEQPSLWFSARVKKLRPASPQTPLSAPSNLAT